MISPNHTIRQCLPEPQGRQALANHKDTQEKVVEKTLNPQGAVMEQP